MTTSHRLPSRTDQDRVPATPAPNGGLSASKGRDSRDPVLVGMIDQLDRLNDRWEYCVDMDITSKDMVEKRMWEKKSKVANRAYQIILDKMIVYMQERIDHAKDNV